MAIEEEGVIRYAGSLLELWLSTTDDDFPIDCTQPPRAWIAPIGFHRTSYWARFNSREELWGRILGLCQLVGAESLKALSPEGEELEVKL